MRKLSPLLFLLLLGAGGKKKKDEVPPPPPPVATPAPAPVEAAPPPAPEPPPPPAAPKNASFNVTVTHFDGTIKAGKVTGVERSKDFYGEDWSSEAKDLTLTVESGTTEKQVTWEQVKSVAVTPGKMGENVDCTYSSDFSPWMYECSLRNTVAVVLKDGSKGTITSRHVWHFYFEDGTKEEFTLYKYFVRQQDDKEVEFGSDAGENTALYTALQDRLRTDAKTVMIKAISL